MDSNVPAAFQEVTARRERLGCHEVTPPFFTTIKHNFHFDGDLVAKADIVCDFVPDQPRHIKCLSPHRIDASRQEGDKRYRAAARDANDRLRGLPPSAARSLGDLPDDISQFESHLAEARGRPLWSSLPAGRWYRMIPAAQRSLPELQAGRTRRTAARRAACPKALTACERRAAVRTAEQGGSAAEQPYAGLTTPGKS
jgi:hypothetical protein